MTLRATDRRISEQGKLYRYPAIKVTFLPILFPFLSIVFILVLINGIHRHELDSGIFGIVEIIAYIGLISFGIFAGVASFFASASVSLSPNCISAVMFGRVTSVLPWSEIQSITRIRSAYYGDARERVFIRGHGSPWWTLGIANLRGLISGGEELDDYAAFKEDLTAKAKEHGIPLLLQEFGRGVRGAWTGKKLTEPFIGLKPNEKLPVDHL